MFSRLRILFAVGVLGFASSDTGWAQDAAQGEAAPAEVPAHAEHPESKDQVYRVERNGRQVYTNAGAVQVRGKDASALDLPELTDLAHASPAQLQLLDNSVQRAHDDTQQGTRCQSIRASLRVPTRSFVFSGHLRELCVGVALLVLSVVVMTAWQGRLRSLMPVAPLLGSLYLGYATYARIDHRLDTLREGLRACSADLPPRSTGVDAVRDRLEQASSLQATIDRAYSQRASLAESALRER